MENDDFLSNFAVDRVYNNYEYDANGNMTKTTKYSQPLVQPSFPAIFSSRNLYWNDSDQLQAMADYSNSAHYFYNYAGDRTWKVVGAKITTTLSGIQRTYNVFNQSTYYLFPQVSITNSAYTKHIFAGTERICSKIGTGKSVDMLQLFLPPTAQITAKRSQQTNLMKRTFSNLCIPNLNPPPIFICAIVNGGNILSINLLSSSAAKITNTATEYEDLQYFYLSDHLGSSSWISDKDGNALQYISYLPYGQLFWNLKTTSYDASYKFIGKERDMESGFDYFGARYYSSPLGVWLSVDPLANERAWSTPYSYCQNNPVGRLDISGALDDVYFDEKGNYLGDDNKGNNIRIITKDQYNLLTDNGNINPNEIESVLKKAGVQFSDYVEQTNMPEASQLNVYNHFNPTSLPLQADNKSDYNMAFIIGSKLSLSINLDKNKNFSNNYNDIINGFIHEKQHYDDYKSLGKDKYLSIPQDIRERRAISTQRNHSSWGNTSSDFESGIDSYYQRFSWSKKMKLLTPANIKIN